MLIFLLSWVVNGTVFLPEYSGIIPDIASHSRVKIAHYSPSLIILAQVGKPDDDDPIVPPN